MNVKTEYFVREGLVDVSDRENGATEALGPVVINNPLLRWFLSHLSGKHVYIDDKPYLSRYYLFGDGGGRWWELYLHVLHIKDTYRWLHNHPWNWFFSLILRNGYTQEVLDVKSGQRYEESIRRISLFRGRARYHSIKELPRGPAWTLVLTARKKGYQWGYWDEDRGCHVPETRVESDQCQTVRFGKKHTTN